MNVTVRIEGQKTSRRRLNGMDIWGGETVREVDMEAKERGETGGKE